MPPKLYTEFFFDVPKREHSFRNGDLGILTKCESNEKLELLRGWWDDDGFGFRQKYQAAIFHEDLASMISYLKAKSVAAASNGDIQSIVEKYESRQPDLVYDGGAGTALVNGIVIKLVDNSEQNQIVAKFLEGGGNFKRWIAVEEYHSLLESLLSQPSVQTIEHLCACEDNLFFDMDLFLTILFEIFRVGDFGVRPDEEVTKLLAECTAPDIGYWEKEIKILRDYLSDKNKKKFDRARRGTNLQGHRLNYNKYFGLARRDYAICDVPVTVYHYEYEYDKKKSAIPVVGIENFKHIWVTTLQRHCSTLSSPEKLKNFITNRMHTNAQTVFDIVFYKLRRDPAPPSVAVATDTKIETDKHTCNKISEGINGIHESEQNQKTDINLASEKERGLLSTTGKGLEGGDGIAPMPLFLVDNDDTSTRDFDKSKNADSSVTLSDEMTGKGLATLDELDISLDSSSARMNQMDIRAVPMFCMDWTCPFILSTYNEDVDIMINAQVLVPNYPKEYFIPDVGKGGTQLEIRIQVPSFFVDASRILQSNAGQAGFNVNTFKDVCKQIDTHYGHLNSIFGATPMIVALPFACEEHLVHWEIQAYPNDNGTLSNDSGGQHFHACLSITLRKYKTKSKTAGGFRVVGAVL